ncbi:MAG: acetyltransferase, including N-acetylase of ribosomal protein [Akkermansiaceae bacterium]|nr:acetyltransferase, including N-acetylase of ribosomal protein [Akkermansiaceae bacterium]
MKPILLDLPESFETARILIRVAKPGDGPAFNEAIVESLEHLRPWLAWTQEAPSLEHSEAVCRRAYTRYLLREDVMMFFFLKETGELVGGGGLHDIDWDFRRFEIGYWGRRKSCGRGLLSEAVRGVVDFARENLQPRRIFLTTDARNERSWRLAERIGFVLEGVLVAEKFDVAGEPRDTRIYRFPL